MFIVNFFQKNHKETDKQLPRGQCGLYNLGNTCYMNSILQSLAHTQLFLHHIETKQVTIINPKANPGKEGRYSKLSDALIDLMKCMNSQKYSICTTHAVKHFSGKLCDNFSGSKQNDASEFLCFCWINLKVK